MLRNSISRTVILNIESLRLICGLMRHDDDHGRLALGMQVRAKRYCSTLMRGGRNPPACHPLLPCSLIGSSSVYEHGCLFVCKPRLKLMLLQPQCQVGSGESWGDWGGLHTHTHTKNAPRSGRSAGPMRAHAARPKRINRRSHALRL
ncbi:hypothetical protein MPH_09847 [Macrophomina phaseolina MS6]|uniref:Uncharacterized protein n=1 Tax=Macrophomina phaseolina (strain MS6) TaxID=1126212 RepID=K2RJS0_MACPH|nr:hypothetical protein MPH_09847 [Macrophomina phaseolina MS6]